MLTGRELFMKTFIASALATILMASFSIPAGEPGNTETYIIKDDIVTYEDGTPADGVMQTIRGNAGEVQTATVTVYFVVE